MAGQIRGWDGSVYRISGANKVSAYDSGGTRRYASRVRAVDSGGTIRLIGVYRAPQNTIAGATLALTTPSPGPAGTLAHVTLDSILTHPDDWNATSWSAYFYRKVVGGGFYPVPYEFITSANGLVQRTITTTLKYFPTDEASVDIWFENSAGSGPLVTLGPITV